MNAGSHDVRQGLLDALAAVAGRDVAGVVLAGAGGTFIAGSDLKEFGAPLGEPQLPAVIAAVEALPLPVVAALDGAALGGGFELALACDARVAAPGTVLGLPEVGLGLVPGAGGTQRLPRLTGRAEAMRLICGALRVRADEALRLGMVDEVATGDLRAAAERMALELGEKRPVAQRAVPEDTAEALEAARAAALKAGKDRPAAAEAIRLVDLAGTMPVAEALAEERRVFQEIRVGEEARALRHIFFAERASGRVPRGTEPREVASAAVIGAGTMGAGIAYALLRAGIAVALIERDDAAAAAGAERMAGLIDGAEKAGRLDAAKAGAMRAGLTTGSDMGAVRGRDLVIEAVFEDMGVKSALMADLPAGHRVRDDLASNTSYLDLDQLATASGVPERVVGLALLQPGACHEAARDG